METTTIKFKREQIAKLAVVSGPGKCALEVSNNVSDKNLVTDENGEKPRYIVSFRAITADKLPQLKEIFTNPDGSFKDEVNIEETNGLFLTGSAWVNSGEVPTLPMRGEIVDAMIDYVEDREKNQVLRITNFQVKAAKKAEKADLSTLFAPAEAVAATSGSLLHA